MKKAFLAVFLSVVRLSQNFSFWESNLGFRGKSGLMAAFSKAVPETNRVLGMALVLGVLIFSCKSPPPPQAEQEAVLPDPSLYLELTDITAEDLGGVRLVFRLGAENPRPQAAALRLSSWTTRINGKDVKEGVNIRAERSPFMVGPGTGGLSGRETKSVIVELDIAALSGAGFTPEEDYNISLSCGADFSYDDAPSFKTGAEASAFFPRIREPLFTITSIAILKAELINTRFRVGLKVDNPNPFAMELSSFDYTLYGNGREWAGGQEKNVLKIEAKSSAGINLFLMMNFINMKRDLLDQIIRLEDVNYRFTGNAQVSTGVDYLPCFTTAFRLSGYSPVYEN
jgi:LEA14-like dessication related protein